MNNAFLICGLLFGFVQLPESHPGSKFTVRYQLHYTAWGFRCQLDKW